MTPEGMLDNIDRLIELETQKIDLLRQLKRALMLADLIGVPAKEIKGRLGYGVHAYGTPLYARPWRTDELVIRLDGVEVARKKLIDVPLDLWPRDVRDEFERQQKRNVRRAHA
jgi:hypothetical protein